MQFDFLVMYYCLFVLYFMLLDSVSHSGHEPTIDISDPSIISKWKNLQNRRGFKYFLSSLYSMKLHQAHNEYSESSAVKVWDGLLKFAFFGLDQSCHAF